MATMFTFKMPTDEKVLAAIGRIAIRHGQMDHMLRMTIKTIANISISEALDATSRSGSAQLRARVRRLAKRRFGEGPTLLRLEALLERSRRATNRRNQLLHGLYGADLDGQEFLKSDDHSWGAVPPSGELNKLADEFYAIVSELNGARLEGFLKEALEAEVA